MFVATVAVAFALPNVAHADKVDRLSKTLATSEHHKARIGAAVSLGRLQDERALEPLVKALEDDNNVVRAVAAAALGRLGDKRALPALKKATKDDDELVRKRATEAVADIRNAVAKKKKDKKAGFGDSGHAVESSPELYVVVKSAQDKSGGKSSEKVRKKRAKKLKKLMKAELKKSPRVTTSRKQAKKHSLETSNIDISITEFTRKTVGKYVEIECTIRIALSDENDKMLSFLTGGAKVQVPKKTFNRQYLPQLREEALDNAVKGIHQDLIQHLRRHNPS